MSAYKFHTAGRDTNTDEPAVLMDVAGVRSVLPEHRLSEALDGAFASGNKEAISAFTEAFTILHEKMALHTPLAPIDAPYSPGAYAEKATLGRAIAFDTPARTMAALPA